MLHAQRTPLTLHHCPRALAKALRPLLALIALLTLLALPTGCTSTPQRSTSRATEWTTIGRSLQNRPIQARTIGSGTYRVLIVNGIHANEPEPAPSIDLAVLGVRSTWNARDFLMGSTAERICRDAGCSILTVRPVPESIEAKQRRSNVYSPNPERRMRIVVYSAKPYEKPFLDTANAGAQHELVYLDARLCPATTDLARGTPVVSIFVGDDATAPVLRSLHAGGTRLLTLRSAGFNHVDVAEADRLGITIARVPAYSPYAVAEHAVGLMLTLNRKFHRAYARVREQNFALDGLMGFDMHGKTAGVIGTGKIGEAVCAILRGFGCRVLAFDAVKNPACEAIGVEYVTLADLYAASDIVTLHCPLTPATKHLLNAAAFAAMKPGVMIINTSRGAVLDTRSLIAALKSGHVGSVGLDVYEEEGDLFFKDLSAEVIQDDVFVRLLTFPNVLITAHQGFFTREACEAIARTTIDNATGFARGTIHPANLVTTRLIAKT